MKPHRIRAPVPHVVKKKPVKKDKGKILDLRKRMHTYLTNKARKYDDVKGEVNW